MAACRERGLPPASMRLLSVSLKWALNASTRARKRYTHPRHGHMWRAISSASEAATKTLPDLHGWKPKDDKLFANIERWVLFSDLHVSSRTRQVCLEVLHTVKKEAEARKAGVLFLGDFWHMRGSLPVEPLNDVIRVFSQWNIPTLMLVGNHDQVTLGGMVHALTPLAAASPYLHIFDAPTLYRGALWLPYRRDESELEAAVTAAVGEDGEGLRAIFAHVDIVGALMNETFQAQDGLPPSLFPPGTPVFTGHYHKPHTVEGTCIRYVGSPYQVSRSEAGQSKHLLVLDSAWQVCEQVPLDIGPRHFDATSATLNELPHQESLRAGDRVRVTLSPEEAQAHQEALSQLQGQGIEIEVVSPAAGGAAPRIQAAEDLGPIPLLSRYAEMTNMTQRALSLGVALLQELEVSIGHSLAVPPTLLNFDWVEVQGYFSFKTLVRYRLGERGLVVVSGRVEDSVESGMESNGAGKTALVMAPLWAVTGGVDARSESGLGRGVTNADIINDDSKAARVKLEGTVNGQPFILERVAVRRGKGAKLSFWLGGEERTQQEMKMTQALIDETLGTSLLGKVVFYGQSEVAALLESNDRAFKDELGKLVDLSVWGMAKEKSKEEVSRRKGELSSCLTQLQVHGGYLARDEEALLHAQGLAAQWEAHRDSRAAALRQDVQSVAQRAQHAQRQLHAAGIQLQGWASAADACCAALEAELAQQEAQHAQHADLADPGTPSADQPGGKEAGDDPTAAAAAAAAERAKGDAELAQQAAQQARQVVQDAQYTLGLLRYKVEERQGVLQQYQALAGWGADLPHDHASEGDLRSHEDLGDGATVCDRCLQPIDQELYNQNIARMQSEVDEAQQAERREAALLAELESQAKAAKTEAVRFADVAAALSAAHQEEVQRRRVQEVYQAQAQLVARQEAERRGMLLRQELSQLRVQLQQAAELAKQAQHGQDSLAQAAAELQQALEDSGGGDLAADSQQPGVSVADSFAEEANSRGKGEASFSPEVGESSIDSLLREAGAVGGKFPAMADVMRQGMAAGQRVGMEAGQLGARVQYMGQEQNPHLSNSERLAASVAEARARLAELEAGMDRLEGEVQDYKQVDDAFSPTGIVNFVLEGVLGDLQEATSRHLAAMTPGITLGLLPCKPAKKSEAAVIEQVQKVIHVRHTATGELRPRSVKQLSGGERRRVAVALAMGFSQLAAQRGRLRSNLLVLDEVMQHMDEEGCHRMASLIKNLPYSSVLVVAQAHSFLTQALDSMDVVVKKGGVSTLEPRRDSLAAAWQLPT